MGILQNGLGVIVLKLKQADLTATGRKEKYMKRVYPSYYDYKNLRDKAVEFDATQEDVDALGEWFELYGERYWSGEYYEVEGDHNLFRKMVLADPETGDYEVVGYEFR